MVSLPTRGTSFRLTACSVTNRTVQRAWPSGRFAANHCDNALLLQIVEQLGGAGTLLLIERLFQAAFAVAVSDLADRLRR